MIRWAANYFASVPPMFIDGLLYVLIAILGALSGCFSTDEAAKFVEPQLLYWLRCICTVSGAGALALKMYRSTSFADHKAEQTKEPLRYDPPANKETPTP